MKFGAILQACRERAGLSQEQLAEKLNRSRSCISKIEGDKKTLDAETLIKWTDLTNAREVAVSFFCGMDGLSIMQHVMQFTVGG
ncbi:helix-turn-helix domain-containing protein [Paenibacillus plantiphilus]|nr:helix-turn-helix transcriptional regulator [Paenibacillus plantiphilus]